MILFVFMFGYFFVKYRWFDLKVLDFFVKVVVNVLLLFYMIVNFILIFIKSEFEYLV